MDDFFTSGRAVDVVLAVIALEYVVLLWRGFSWRSTAALLLPAIFILLALRAALIDAPWPWIALSLTLAFPAHLADLALRARNDARAKNDEPRR